MNVQSELTSGVQIQASNHYTLFKRGGQYVCAATSTGFVQLLDPKSFSVIKSWKAHLGWINDMDANPNFLVTCGWSPHQQFGSMLDPLAKVFDLKTLMPLPPVPFHVGAAHVRMHPRMLDTGIIASRTGQLQFVDITSGTMVGMRQLNLMDSQLTCLDVSASGEAIAVADASFYLQLWGSPSGVRFTNYSNPTEFPDADSTKLDPLNLPQLDWAGQTPLNLIGMPYYRDSLLSAWPPNMVFEIGAPTIEIDSSIQSSLTRTDFGYYAPNPRKTRRNQVTSNRSSKSSASLMEGPKFLSEQAKEAEKKGDHGRRMSDVLESLKTSGIEAGKKFDVPMTYRNVEIKYSKFGIEDFDFEYYNKTKYSGLETHISNAYLNPFLQLMRFTNYMRNISLHHTASTCLYESCLLCELGFLIDMLEKAEGQNCQATNFLRTFSNLSSTKSLGLLEEGTPPRPLTLLVQATARFLIEKLASDFRQTSPHTPLVDNATTTSWALSIRCTGCSSETVRPGGSYIHDLAYPPRNPPKHIRTHGPSFSQVLKASVERSDQTRGWCERCKRYQHLQTRKSIQTIPPVLMINAAVHSSDAKQTWGQPRWLPQEIGIIVEQGQFFCYEGRDLDIHLHRGAYSVAVYELTGVVADINSGDNQKSHLVSLINGESNKIVVVTIRELTLSSLPITSREATREPMASIQ